MSFKAKLTTYLRAAYPALWIQTAEEGRLMADVHQAMRDYGYCSRVYEWDIHRGLSYVEFRLAGAPESANPEDKDKVNRASIKDTSEVNKLLEWLEKNFQTMPKRSLVVFKDFHPYLIDPKVVRRIRNLLNEVISIPVVLVFVSPVLKIPVELEKEIQTLDYLLPTVDELCANVDYVLASLVKSSGNKQGQAVPTLSPEIRRLTAEAARGMTAAEANNAGTFAWVKHQAFNQDYVRTVFTEKVTQVKRAGLLTHLPSDISFDQIGGLHGLKRWVRHRGKGYSEAARAYGLPYPKGMLLCGVPGCGKTMLAKAVASEFGFPLFQLDVGALFSPLVGATEANFREMIRTVEALGRCVLLLDEVEKSLNREAISGRGDTGTSSRSFGTLLSWLSDRESPVFVIGTSNRFDTLPPELIRKGRFDELWWLDLPTQPEREDIFRVMLLKHKRKPEQFDLTSLAAASAGFTGAEIQEILVASMFDSFGSGEADVTMTGLLGHLRGHVPQSKISQDDPNNPGSLSALREKAKTCLRSASDEATEELGTGALRAISIGPR